MRPGLDGALCRIPTRPHQRPTASAKHALRALAKRWLDLDAEVRSHDSVLVDLTATASPTLRDGFGIGARHRSRDLDRLGRQPRTDPLRGGLRDALRDLPRAGILRDDQPSSALSGRAPAGQRRPVSDSDCAHALPSAHQATISNDERLRDFPTRTSSGGSSVSWRGRHTSGS